MALSSPSRALVYAFHDLDGVVDDANHAYLAALVEQAQRSIVVVNGDLEPASRLRIEALGASVIRRPNEGYDVWAFKTGIDALRDDLDAFDELIVANSSVFGPVRPLDEAFREMDARDVDFWGITRHAAPRARALRIGRTPPEERSHIQSYFTAFRRSVLQSAAFRDYWRDLPPIRDYADAVRAHEMVMTGHFEDAGFSWDTLVDTTDLEPFSENPLIGMAALLLERGCPVFKRRLLYIGADGLLAHSSGATSQRLWDRLGTMPGVDREALERHVARTIRAEDAHLALQDFVPIDDGAPATIDDVAAVIVPGPLAAWHAEEMRSMGVRAVRMTGARREPPPLEGVETVRTGKLPAHLALELVDAPLLYVLTDLADAHHESDARVADEHARAALGWSPDELGRIAAAFAASPALGAVLAPPSPARNFYGGIGGARGADRTASMLAVCRELGLDARSTGDTLPGGGLWVRHDAAAQWSAMTATLPSAVRDEAIRLLQPHDWTSLMVAALPRLGWRVRRGMSRSLAETLVAVSAAAYAGVNRAAGTREGEGLAASLARLDTDSITATVFFDLGPGFAHATSQTFALRTGEPVEVRVTVPKHALGVRFDPLEGAGAIVSGIAIEPASLSISPMNGTPARGVDFFSSHDPAYAIGGPLPEGTEIVIRAERIERVAVDPAALELVERRFGGAGPASRVRHLAMRVSSKTVRTLRRRR